MSLPRYPKYRDSGVEWLGEVPQHWMVKAVRTIASVVRGASPRPAGDPLYFGGDAVPWVTVGEITKDDRMFLAETETFLTAEGALHSNLFTKGTVIYSNSGATLGVPKILRIDACANDGVVAFENLSCEVHPEFLYHYLASITDAIREKVKQGSGQPNLNTDIVKDLHFGLPPLVEQLAIDAFLDRETTKIDGLVAEQRRLIELLKEKRQAVISHAVTKGLNAHATMKPSGIEWLGDVPSAWTVTRLGRAAFMQEGPGLRNWQFTDEGTRVICVTNITENGIDFSLLEKFISPDEYSSTYSHFTVQTGDVLLSSSGNSWGKVAIYESHEKVILNTSTIRLNESEGRPMLRDFLAMLLQSDTVREQLGLAMTGSCQPNFGPTHLKSVIVALPSFKEQSDIVAFLALETTKLDALIVEARRAIDLLQERRTALISAAVTGKIDVRGLVQTVTA